MENQLKEHIRGYNDYMLGKHLISEHRKSELLLATINDLVNTYTDYEGNYPFSLCKINGYLRVTPIGNIKENCKNKTIMQFSIEHKIYNEKDYIELVESVGKYRSIIPTNTLSLEYENSLKTYKQQKEPFYKRWFC